jgi:hypothetical protein
MPLRKTERLFQVLDAIVPALCLIRSGEFLIREVTQSMIILADHSTALDALKNDDCPKLTVVRAASSVAQGDAYE